MTVRSVPIVANDDEYLVGPFNLLANDSIPAGVVATVVLVSGPEHGTVDVSTSGIATYTPGALGALEPDFFTYRIEGSAGRASNVARVRVNAAAQPLASLHAELNEGSNHFAMVEDPGAEVGTARLVFLDELELSFDLPDSASMSDYTVTFSADSGPGSIDLWADAERTLPILWDEPIKLTDIYELSDPGKLFVEPKSAGDYTIRIRLNKQNPAVPLVPPDDEIYVGKKVEELDLTLQQFLEMTPQIDIPIFQKVGKKAVDPVFKQIFAAMDAEIADALAQGGPYSDYYENLVTARAIADGQLKPVVGASFGYLIQEASRGNISVLASGKDPFPLKRLLENQGGAQSGPPGGGQPQQLKISIGADLGFKSVNLDVVRNSILTPDVINDLREAHYDSFRSAVTTFASQYGMYLERMRVLAQLRYGGHTATVGGGVYDILDSASVPLDQSGGVTVQGIRSSINTQTKYGFDAVFGIKRGTNFGNVKSGVFHLPDGRWVPEIGVGGQFQF